MSEGSCLLKFCYGAARRRARLLIRCAVSSSAPWCLPALLSAAYRRRRRLCGQPRMEGARGGPRSASELAAAAKGYGELLAAGLVTPAAHDEQLKLLRAEATALLAAPRARSSTGDAGSPAPTSVCATAAAASAPAAAPLSAVAAPLSLLDQPAAAAAPARSAPAKRAAEERSEAAVQATLRALHPPKKPTAAPLGCRGILSMPARCARPRVHTMRPLSMRRSVPCLRLLPAAALASPPRGVFFLFSPCGSRARKVSTS